MVVFQQLQKCSVLLQVGAWFWHVVVQPLPLMLFKRASS